MGFDGFGLLLSGALVTAEIAALSAVLALVLAAVAGVLRSRRTGAAREIASCYVELFRGTSLIVQLFWFYFVLPQFGIALSAKLVAVLALGLNYGAYGAEIVRGALLAVPAGQIEAARSMALRSRQLFLLIVVPQALVVFIRPWGNLMVQLLKATSLVSLITIADLSYRAYQLNQVTMHTFQIFGIVLVIYFIMAQLIARTTNALDRRCGRWRAAGGAT